MAAPSVRLHPDAIAGAKAAYDWYAKRNPTGHIQKGPERWTMHLHGTRRFLLRLVPYAVVYRIAESTVQVIAVAHGRRRPGYWKSWQVAIG